MGPARHSCAGTERRAWVSCLRGLAGLLALGALSLTAGCGSVLKPKDGAALPQAETQRDAAPGGRNVSTLAKSPSRRPGAVVGTRSDPDALPAPVMKMVGLDASEEDGPFRLRPPPSRAPGGRAVTEFVRFASAPFPYDGAIPGRGPFLNVEKGERRGHRSARGTVLWEDATFSDDRVLLHVPEGFDPGRQAVMVVFFHGHGATLRRDVLERQQIAAQVSASGANAVLVAPQFARDARNSSAGKFWEPGGFTRFLDEAAGKLAALTGDRGAASRFAKMPVVVVSYSGGYVPAAWSLEDVAGTARVRGVLMLDSLYGEEERFASWIAASRSAFFVSAYTRYTARRNAGLESLLAERGVATRRDLPQSLSRGGVSFLATGAEANHDDYCTLAWTESPLRDVLARLPELHLRDPETVASIGARRRRSADAEPR